MPTFDIITFEAESYVKHYVVEADNEQEAKLKVERRQVDTENYYPGDVNICDCFTPEEFENEHGFLPFGLDNQ